MQATTYTRNGGKSVRTPGWGGRACYALASAQSMMEGLGGWRTLKHSAVLRGDLSGGSPRLPLHSELKLEDLEAFQFAESSQRGVQVAMN